MGKTIMGAVVSLDGFIADDEEVGPLLDCTQASADFMRRQYRNMAATVIGRRVFDLTNGWNGKPAGGSMSSSSPEDVHIHARPRRVERLPDTA